MASSSYARMQLFAMLFVGAVVFVSAAHAARADASITTDAINSDAVDIPWEAELAILASEQFNTLYHGYDTLNTTNIHNSIRLLMGGMGLHISNVGGPQSSAAANTVACKVGCEVGIGSCKAACSYCFGCCSSACDLGMQPCLNSCGNSLRKTSDPLRAA